MIPFSLHDIAPVLYAEKKGPDCTILSVSVDSRKISDRKKCLFVALKGTQFDAHDFAAQSVSAGAVALLVNRKLPLDVPQLIVADTQIALGQLGAWVRQQVPARVVALTGSSGKTAVKEMTTAILSQCGHVLSTEGNYNNKIGVPLTLLNLTIKHDFAVIELGANHFGEIAWTTSLVQPETALINNISAAHLSGFGSLSGVAQAKGEIFIGLLEKGCGILNSDSYDCQHWSQILGRRKVWRFSLHASDGVDFFASNITTNDQQGMCFILHTPKGACSVKIPLLGWHNIANALAASALSLSVGATLPSVINGFKKLQSVPGRLFPIPLRTGQLLLDDSYNANIDSMIAAIQVLSARPGYQVMVVGDMAELGDKAVEYHLKVGKVIAMSKINKVLSISPLSHFISKASGRGECFWDRVSLISRLVNLFSEHELITVLVKGSRSSRMEQVVYALQEKLLC